MRGVLAVLGLVVGWGFVGAGLFAWSRDPENRVGMLMAATGFAWLLSLTGASDIPLLFTFGTAIGSLFFATAAHMLLAAPDGRLHSTFERRLVAAIYGVTLLVLPLFLFTDPQQSYDCDNCPENLLLIRSSETVVDVLGATIDATGLVLVGVVLFVLIRRYRRAVGPERRLYGPLYLAGIALMVALLATLAVGAAARDSDATDFAWIAAMVPLALMPFIFLAAFIRARMLQGGAVGELVSRLGEAPRPGELRDALAEALSDPSLELVYWLPESTRFVDGTGRAYTLPKQGSGRAVAPVEREGETIAAIIYDGSLTGARDHVRAVGAATALALENERLDAELRAKLQELRGSRERMLRVGLEERRRLERNLHDGAQQRLVSIALNAAGRALEAAPGPGRRRDTARRRRRGARIGARGAARARPRTAPGGALRARPAHRDRNARPARSRPRGARPRAVRAPARGDRAGRLLRRLRGPHERGEVRCRQPGDRERRASQRASRCGGHRRRGRRRRPRKGQRPTRPRRPDGGARGPPRGGIGARKRNDREGEHPMRVVVADDSVLLREGVVRLLEESGFEVVAQAGDAEDLIRKVGAHKPDVAVVDIRMPPTNTDDGLRAALEIRATHPETGVLVLSQYVEEGYALELVSDSAGGVGYLLKDRVADVERFVESVKRVAEGGSALDPEVVAQLVGRARRDDPLAELTPREREVLELMAEGRSNRAIAEHMVVTERAVEKHVTSIFGKLGLTPAAEDHRRVLAVLAFLRT